MAHARAVGRLVAHLRHHLRAGPAGVPARVPPSGRARGQVAQRTAPTLWDVDFRTAVSQAELEDRERPRRLPPAAVPPGRGRRRRVDIETTRPELLPACVALVAHPDDERYRPLFGTEVVTPLFGVRVPVVGPRAGRSREGVGHRHDLHLRRHHRRDLVARALPSHPDHRRARRPPAPGRVGHRGLGVRRPRRRRLRLRGAGRPHGQAGPDPHRRAAARSRAPSSGTRARSPTRSSSTRRATGPSRSSSSRQWFVRTLPLRQTGCWPGARSSAGTRPTWPTATGPGWRG